MIASTTELMHQAPPTVEYYFKQAKRILDESGLPYTAGSVVALVSVMAQDFDTAVKYKMFLESTP